MIVTMTSQAAEQVVLASSSSSSLLHDSNGGATQEEEDDVPRPLERKQSKKRASIVSIKKGATKPEQQQQAAVETIDFSLDGVSRHVCPKRGGDDGVEGGSSKFASARPSIFAINKRMSSSSIGTWGSSRSSTVATSSIHSASIYSNGNRRGSYVSLSSTGGRSTISGGARSDQNNLNEDDEDDLNDGTKISSNTINGFGVRFRSRKSIEQVKRILRLSDYNMDEIQAMYGTDEEELERKQILQEQILEFGEYADAMMDEYENSNDEVKFDRRVSDNSYTTIGIRDKCGPRLQEKIESREAGWDAVMWDQHDQIQEITETAQAQQQLLLDDEDITETENDEVGDDVLNILPEINNIVILDDQRLAETYHQSASRDAQIRAQEEAKELEQEVLGLLHKS